MRPVPVSEEKIEVKMLGEFSITMNGHQLTNLKGRTKRVWMLIEYLIANRHKDISIQKLSEVLWEEDTCSDPLNALKNLVYRARQLLKGISQNENAEYIQYSRNTYSWNNAYNITIDTEQLIASWKQGNDTSKSLDSRINAYKNAISLYCGEFLPKSSHSSWVVSLESYFANIYNECVLRSCGLLIDKHLYHDVIRICEDALAFAPLEEPIHKILLFAYITTEQRNKALDHYNQVIDMFYKELGVDVSESMRPLYKELINSINQIEMDLSIIKDDLKEASSVAGAYYCDYDIFKSIYRVQARSIARSGKSTYIVLFTLSDLNGEILEHSIAKLATSRLKSAILGSLRKGDAVASYSATQFIVMLPLDNYEDAEKVTARILQKFRFRYRKDNVKLTTRINALDSVE